MHALDPILDLDTVVAVDSHLFDYNRIVVVVVVVVPANDFAHARTLEIEVLALCIAVD